jgi:hypothetical protein
MLKNEAHTLTGIYQLLIIPVQERDSCTGGWHDSGSQGQFTGQGRDLVRLGD